MHYSKLQFPKGSVFLVTGGAGFIGSNLCEAIILLGHKVKCLDNFSTGFRENLSNFSKHPLFELIEGDICNVDDCLKATEKVDYVLHHAAYGSVPRSIKMPLVYEEVNIKGQLNMLEASRRNGVKKFIYASSSSVYGDDTSILKVEGNEGDVVSPYALTKRVNEEYARLYKKIYGLDTYGLRYFNVFGRRQSDQGIYAAVIPKFVFQISNNQQSTIYGDGLQSRDFTYIENVIDANLKACLSESQYSGQVFNIASGERQFLSEVYKLISKKINDNYSEPLYISERLGDIRHSSADISKAVRELGYTVSYSFNQGIEEYLR